MSNDKIFNEYEVIDHNRFENYYPYENKTNFDHKSFIIMDILRNIKKDVIKQDFTDHIQIERNIYVHYHEWYNDIKNSYKNNNNIFKQFEIDFQRSILYCNGHIVNNTDEFMKYIQMKCDQKTIYTILMFCTQASLGLPFEIIHKSLDDNYYVSEIKNKKVDQHNKSQYINVYVDDEIYIKIEKKLRIFILDNYQNDKTLYIISIFLDFDLKNNYVNFRILYKPVNE